MWPVENFIVVNHGAMLRRVVTGAIMDINVRRARRAGKTSVKQNAFRDARRSKNAILLRKMVRPERFELPTFWFVARRSIQLS